MKYRWSLAPAQPALASFLAGANGVSTLLAQCLLNRGLSEPAAVSRFLDPRLQHLSDPFELPNMAAATARLLDARARGEPLMIFGDYDVDGVSATALLAEVLRKLGWQVDCYLPNRLEEGYGLTQAAAQNCLGKAAAPLWLAVDCGSTAIDTIAWLKQQGVDVIVLDHHQVSSPLPPAFALVNPRCPTLSRSAAASPATGLTGSHPRFTELCSAGLAFKLAHALVKEGRRIGLPGADTFDLRPLLDLVALGTIADVVPLIGENRVLVRRGLERLNQTERPGLIALKRAAGITGSVGGYEVAFQLSPRLNAAGRLENAQASLQLLLAGSLEEAMPLAARLDATNRERQQIERHMAEQAIGAVRARFNPASDFVIVEGQLRWHIGVVGIVASRVLQEFHRPTFILGGEADEWRGSGRSIEGFDLAAALRTCGDLLIRHGGHALAAGVSIQPANVDAFRARLNDLARRTLKPEQLVPTLVLDAEVPLAELTLERVRELDKLKETGNSNPPVQLLLRDLSHARPVQRIGAEKKHARLWVTDRTSTREAVMWGIADGSLPVGKFDLAVAPRLNHYNGTTAVQLKVLAWRPAE